MNAPASVKDQFAQALVADASLSFLTVQIVAHETTRWATATFTGNRHMLTIDAPFGATLEGWLHHLPDTDWDLVGYLVADIAVGARHDHGPAGYHVELEALTVDDLS